MPESGRYDVVVIGAGIQGAGVAQAAAAAGYRVLVVERSAPAAGTSSASSKLIHGGLRYLESGQFRLVREALRERERLLRNAPELVHRLPCHIPVYRHTARRPMTVNLGLALYGLLGGGPGFRRIPLRRWDNPDGLDTRDLEAVFLYHDAQTDDAALTRAVLDSAMAMGARLACPAETLRIERQPDGYGVSCSRRGRMLCVSGSTLVNAAGPWVNQVLRQVEPPLAPLSLERVQGAHLVLRGSLSAGGYYVEAPDRRAVFILPWQRGTTLLGTTETPFDGDPDAVRAQPAEVAYLLDTFARYFPERPHDILAEFAGLRVLPRGIDTPFGRSRETLLATDGADPPRMVSVCGGKLTTYRATGQKVMQLLRRALPPPSRDGDSRRIRLAPAG